MCCGAHCVTWVFSWTVWTSCVTQHANLLAGMGTTNLSNNMCPGARSLLYGSALGLGGVMLAGSAALRYADVASPEEFRERMRAWASPFAASVQEALLPLKAHVKVGQLPYCFSDCSPRRPHVSMQRRCGLQCLELKNSPLCCSRRSRGLQRQCLQRPHKMWVLCNICRLCLCWEPGGEKAALHTVTVVVHCRAPWRPGLAWRWLKAAPAPRTPNSPTACGGAYTGAWVPSCLGA